MATQLSPKEAAHVVREYYESLSQGRVVDALNLFSTDATFTDEEGKESKGIREIAASLLEYRKPNSVSLERLEDRGREVLALYHTSRTRHYRGVFSVDRGRIRSVRVERLA
ncbi:MAG TPA: nuclear transport factor 2 family protein [Thermoplasmata archaeon]|nr:nuclear transport factor 2 family protein [Thermoplasmata archaeon]